MAERGKPEQSQHEEDAGRRAELDDFVSRIREGLELFSAEGLQVRDPGVDPSDVDVVVEAKLASTPVMVVFGEHFRHVQRGSRVSRSSLSGSGIVTFEADEPDESIEKDDAYYDEVRQAVGRGAPSVLLGTSTKSLQHNLEKLRTVHGAGSTSQTTSPASRARKSRYATRWPSTKGIFWPRRLLTWIVRRVFDIFHIEWVSVDPNAPGQQQGEHDSERSSTSERDGSPWR